TSASSKGPRATSSSGSLPEAKITASSSSTTRARTASSSRVSDPIPAIDTRRYAGRMANGTAGSPDPLIGGRHPLASLLHLPQSPVQKERGEGNDGAEEHDGTPAER